MLFLGRFFLDLGASTRYCFYQLTKGPNREGSAYHDF